MASRTVRVRLDSRSEADLELLLRDGGTESDVVRAALAEAAGRRRRVRSDDLWLLNTVVVATSMSARAATLRPEVIVAGQRTRALCEQVRTVDVQRLDGMVGVLTAAELLGVEDAPEIVLEL